MIVDKRACTCAIDRKYQLQSQGMGQHAINYIVQAFFTGWNVKLAVKPGNEILIDA